MPSEIPKSALYWLGEARNESNTMAERLLYMENAYNHVVNALLAPAPVSPTTTDTDEHPLAIFDAGFSPTTVSKCVKCGHDRRFFYQHPDPFASGCMQEDEDGICGCHCEFPSSEGDGNA